MLSRRRMALVGSLAILIALLTGTGTNTTTAQLAPGNGCTATYKAPDTSAATTEMRAVSFAAPNDGWAVGWYGGPGPRRAVIFHWAGTAWSRSPIPDLGPQESELSGVIAFDRNDAWAVGTYGSDPGTRNKLTLFLRWDGQAWRHMPLTGLGKLGDLRAMAGTARNDIWAIGSYYAPDLRSWRPIALHWDGAQWSPTDLPDLGSDYHELSAISARAPDDVWIAGIRSQNGTRPLFLHWNGRTWTRVAGPDEDVRLTAVLAQAANDAWAVGLSREGAGILRWDGASWRRLATPDFARGATYPFALAAFSRDDVWVASVAGVESGPHLPSPSGRLHVMRWDGRAWSEQRVNASSLEVSAGRLGAATSNGKLWIAGTHLDPEIDRYSPLLLSTNRAPCANPSSTPTPRPALNPPVPLPGSGSMTFPETGKTISGIFLRYWRDHGGLAQQGYPISDVIGEASDLDGRLYTVQYFERAVFEYHPEYRNTRYEVLLSQLGTFQYKKRYPGGAPNQQPNYDIGTRYFPETGKRLGGAFHHYWVTHGGLMQQGYPISEELTERSPLDGKLYTVQYFERAIFEWHPENRDTPYEVLLSHLGRFRYEDKYGAAPAPPPQAAPFATPVPRLISGGVNGYAAPVVTDRYIFWIGADRQTWPIYGYDLQEGSQFLVTNRPERKVSLTGDGKWLLWVEGPPETMSRSIKGYDLDTRREFTVVESGPFRVGEDRMSLSGDFLYYVGGEPGRYGIVRRNLVTGHEEVVVEQGRGPAVSGDVLAWSKEVANCSPGSSHPPCSFHQELYARKGTQQPVMFATVHGQYSGGLSKLFEVSGDNILWNGAGSPPGGPVNLYNVATNTSKSISALPGQSPVIRGNLVAWAGSEDYTAIKAYDLGTGRIIMTVPAGGKWAQTAGITGRGEVVYVVPGPNPESSNLYLVSTGR